MHQTAKANSRWTWLCAGCNVGYIDHHLPIAEKLPHLVKSITTTAKKFMPITLSGIVTSDAATQDAAQSLKTQLKVIIEYHIPFLQGRTQSVSQDCPWRSIGQHHHWHTHDSTCKDELRCDRRHSHEQHPRYRTFPSHLSSNSKTAPDFTGVKSGEPKLLASNTEHISYEVVQAIRAFIAESNNKQVVTIEGM
jgi:hypothetical protein